MATNWKYATIPAEMRLDMLKDGNEELYKEEIARTQDAITTRLEAGLDVSEQMKWADTVSYNYNLGNASKMGIPEQNVQKTGYADKLYGNLTVSDRNGTVSTVTNPKKLESTPQSSSIDLTDSNSLQRSLEKSYVKALNKQLAQLSGSYNSYVSSLNEEYEKKKKDAIREFYKMYEITEEDLMNIGYSSKSGKGLTERMRLKEQLSDILLELDSQKSQAVSQAMSELNEKIYQLQNSARSSFSNDFQHYNSLVSEKEEREYQKEKDAAENSKWWAEFSANNALSKEKLDFEKSQSAFENELAGRKLENESSKDAADYEKWLREFEESVRQYNTDNSFRNEELSAEKARDFIKQIAEMQYNDAKLALEREKFEYDKESDMESRKSENENSTSSSYYINCLNDAKDAMEAVTYDSGIGKYKRKYSDAYVNALIENFSLSDYQKQKIRESLGLD